jgi:hypothetical protein
MPPPPTWQQQPTVIGSHGGQTGKRLLLLVYGTTTDTTPLTVDTGYKPPDGHSASLSIVFNCVDRTAQKTYTQNMVAVCRNFGGLAIPGTTSFASGGDGMSTNPQLQVSGGGTLAIEFAMGFWTGTVDWICAITVYEN